MPIPLLFIGATGMVARPIVRVLAADPRFGVAAFVRDPARSRGVLPGTVRLIEGDVRDASALGAAMDGMEMVYSNFNTPFNRRAAFDPDRDGTALVLAAAKRAGVRRVARTSALGVPEAESEWWAIERKTRTDIAVMESGLGWTIFRPTWLMECLPLMVKGPVALQPRFGRRGDFPIWWIAGEDLGRMVAAALAGEGDRIVRAQGPEGVNLATAVSRFARARRAMVVPVPGVCMRMGAMVDNGARYFVDLLDMSRRHTAALVGEREWAEFGRPGMNIEDYAASIGRTGDWPRK